MKNIQNGKHKFLPNVVRRRNLLKNKKGVAAGIVDFYAAVFIVLIIIAFFFIMGIRADKIMWNIHGESLALDATQIALLYAQSTVNTSQGTMTIAEFLDAVSQNNALEEELEKLTKSFFEAYATKLPYGLSVKIIFVQNDDEDSVFYYENYDTSKVSRGADISPASELLLPLRTPEAFAAINVRTVSTKEYMFKFEEK